MPARVVQHVAPAQIMVSIFVKRFVFAETPFLISTYSASSNLMQVSYYFKLFDQPKLVSYLDAVMMEVLT